MNSQINSIRVMVRLKFVVSIVEFKCKCLSLTLINKKIKYWIYKRNYPEILSVLFIDTCGKLEEIIEPNILETRRN